MPGSKEERKKNKMEARPKETRANLKEFILANLGQFVPPTKV